jgi:hypothetical protein
VTALYEAGCTGEDVDRMSLDERREVMANNPVASCVAFRKSLLALLRVHFNWDPENHEPIDGATGAWGRIKGWFLCVEEQVCDL